MTRTRAYRSDETPIICACGCKGIVPKARYASQQARYIRHHQHRGEHNGNYRGGKVTKPCAVCGNPFEIPPSKSSERVTCGNDTCYREWQRLTTSARGQNRTKVPCDQCGTELRLYPSQIQKYNYCNRYCQGQHHARMIPGVNNGNWKGGKWRYYQEQTRIRDGYKCVICGFDLATDIHHITPRHKGGSDSFSNLITLCPNHHRLADIGIINIEHLRRTDWEPTIQFLETDANH